MEKKECHSNKYATMQSRTNKTRSGPDRGEIWKMINKLFAKRAKEDNASQERPIQEVDDNVSVTS